MTIRFLLRQSGTNKLLGSSSAAMSASVSLRRCEARSMRPAGVRLIVTRARLPRPGQGGNVQTGALDSKMPVTVEACGVRSVSMSLSSSIEHTCLRADATVADIEKLCAEAITHDLFGVCVNPSYVPMAEELLRGTRVQLVTVVGFPLGANRSRVKADEASLSLEDGAHEIEMVMPIGFAVAGDFTAVARHVARVRRATEGATLKVILETGFLDGAGIQRAAEVAVSEGADFVKTCTGFGPRGASIEDVQLLRDVVRGRAGVKASGGIRTRSEAEQMIEAGATRIGTSRGVDIVRG